MPRKLPFVKMHGAGNDYVYINCFEQDVPDPQALAPKISDRHFGVGSDGLVLVLPSKIADVRMRMFNADGSEAEMCGNASRCVAKFAYDHKLVDKTEIRLETAAGIRVIKLQLDASGVTGATVDMGEPILDPPSIPAQFPGSHERIVHELINIAGQEYAATAVSMGNPHAVYFLENIAGLDLAAIGPAFETHAWFPRRTNTEFVEVINRHKIKMRVWERGAGETLACGTGACAAVVASVLNKRTERKVQVELLGGGLVIDWDESTNHVFMTGAATTVFTGEYLLPQTQKQEG